MVEFLKDLGVGLILLPFLVALLIGFGFIFVFLIEVARSAFSTDALVSGVFIVGGIGLLGLIVGMGADFRNHHKGNTDA